MTELIHSVNSSFEEKKLLSTVSLFEKNQIRRYFERNNSLKELKLIVPLEDKTLLKQINKDINQVQLDYQNWWEAKSKEYGWVHDKFHHWEINFDTGDVTIVKNIV